MMPTMKTNKTMTITPMIPNTIGISFSYNDEYLRFEGKLSLPFKFHRSLSRRLTILDSRNLF
jgi:hypothetical protein